MGTDSDTAILVSVHTDQCTDVDVRRYGLDKASWVTVAVGGHLSNACIFIHLPEVAQRLSEAFIEAARLLTEPPTQEEA